MPIIDRLVEYHDGSTLLEGYFAYPHDLRDDKPAVLIVHMWAGRIEFVCEQARRLANLGYPAYALDMYGKDIRGSNNEENARLMQPFIDDRGFLLQRMGCGLQSMQDQTEAGGRPIVAIGYCFGGLCVLDLARAGADVAGVVSVHGLLDPPRGDRTKKITSKVLALQGACDPLADLDMLTQLQKELTLADADWQTIVYSHAKHAFTNPAANNEQAGTVYHPPSEQRAWRAILNFLAECSA